MVSIKTGKGAIQQRDSPTQYVRASDARNTVRPEATHHEEDNESVTTPLSQCMKIGGLEVQEHAPILPKPLMPIGVGGAVATGMGDNGESDERLV